MFRMQSAAIIRSYGEVEALKFQSNYEKIPKWSWNM